MSRVVGRKSGDQLFSVHEENIRRDDDASSGRHHAGNNLSAVAPIDPEVRIGGKNDRVRKRFGHAHETGVGEAHGHVYVFLQELEYRLHVVVQIESGNKSAAAKQRAESRRAARAKKVEGLRQDGFAGAPG